ncbi:MAG TPA: DUF1629 domain-containing protein [Fibrobacteria bacterium]|nr:DUF1629 domain-containing protein [Fibrobacteria bacterium]
MRFFEIKTGTFTDETFCILNEVPDGAHKAFSRLMNGDPVSGETETPIQMHMTNHRGLKMTSLIDNTMSILLVSEEMKDAIAELVTSDIEIFPTVIFNHRKRVASNRHFIINPLGIRDCLDYKNSTIQYSKRVPGAIVAIDNFVLDPRKLDGVPHLFRMKEKRNAYILSESLVGKLQKLRPTNVFVKELALGPEGGND